MTIKDFANRVADVGEDLVTLDVLTVSGEIKVTLGGDKIDFNNLMKSIQSQVAETAGTVYVVAYTRMGVDKDTTTFVKEGLSESEAPLIHAHEAMVKTAQEARLAAMNFVREIL